MSFRLARLSLGGKLSVGYLVIATLLVLRGDGRTAEWAFVHLWLPVAYLLWVLSEAFYGGGRLPPAIGVPLFAVLWAANAYFWGHLIAAAARVIVRVSGRRQPAVPPDRTAG